MAFPTFDEWYKAKHGGFSFDAHWVKPTNSIHESFMALSKFTREYVSEMVAAMEKPSVSVPRERVPRKTAPL